MTRGEVEWEDSGDEEATLSCPHCRQPIHEDAQMCPHCENWITEEAGPQRKPAWFVLTAVVCLLIVLLWIFGAV